MKRFFLILTFLFLAVNAWSQPVKLEGRLQFLGALVNDEYDASGAVLASSRTLGVVRLSPYVGLRFGENHRLQVGAALLKYMGTPGEPLSIEPACWYQLDKPVFTLAAGIFPRALLKGRYSTAILSDGVRMLDAHLEGFLLSWHKEQSFYEIALDWNGKFGSGRREQFNIISYGEGWVTPWMALCWEGMFHHYACSEELDGVVDDHLLHPFVKFSLGQSLGLDRLDVAVGGMAGYQVDRLFQRSSYPLGGELTLDISHWGFGLKNMAYYGGSQAPFYQLTDAGGNRYANSLYMRSSLWQITPDAGPGLYDCLDLYWGWRVGRMVDLMVKLRGHFGSEGFIGHQQILQVLVNLDALSFKRKEMN